MATRRAVAAAGVSGRSLRNGELLGTTTSVGVSRKRSRESVSRKGKEETYEKGSQEEELESEEDASSDGQGGEVLERGGESEESGQPPPTKKAKTSSSGRRPIVNPESWAGSSYTPFDVVSPVTTAFVAAASGAQHPQTGAAMAKYMRDLFPFWGLKAPERRSLQRAVCQELEESRAYPLTSLDQVKGAVLSLWDVPQREAQSFGVDLLRSHVKLLQETPIESLGVIELLLRTKAWWDTVDLLASGVVGPLVEADKSGALLRLMKEDWINDDFLWIRRSALLFQLGYNERTDEDLLFALVRKRMHEPDFFIQKAIGWALRNQARHSQKSVREFLLRERNQLSPLSLKEAAKHFKL